METNTFLISLAILLQIALLIILLVRTKHEGGTELLVHIKDIKENSQKFLADLNAGFKENRTDAADHALQHRTELSSSLEALRASNSDALGKLTEKIDVKLGEIGNKQVEKLDQQKTQIKDSIEEFSLKFERNVKSQNEQIKEKFELVEKAQSKLINDTEKKLEFIRTTVEEKLEKTLSERLGQSFEVVSKQLAEVQQGLGEMQNIASDVGGLKKVLTNVKMRGGFGEVQLGALLENTLAPNQYATNIATVPGSSARVEYAICLPGKDDEGGTLYLPIDAKFPQDAYEQVVDAYDRANPDEIEAASKNLENVIRSMGKDIHGKYISPPHTTDFAIMFLPFEGIYAEVVRRTALTDELRNKYNVEIAGPSTLVALLNSLQMGFRTLVIQQRSAEVWRVLGAVKTEFEKFGGLLEKAHKQIKTAESTVEQLVGTRSKAINRKLREIDKLPDSETQLLLGTIEEDPDSDEGDIEEVADI